MELSELYRQQFDNIVTKWTNALQELEHASERTESLISRRSDYASDYVHMDEKTNASQENIIGYQGLVKNAQDQITKKAAELVELRRKLDEAVSNSDTTGIYKGSEAYYEMLAEIQQVESEIDGLNSDIIGYSNSISEAYMDIFDNVAQGYEEKLELAGHLANFYNNSLELAEAKGYLATEKYYEMLKGVTADNIAVMQKEADELSNALYAALASGEIEKDSKAYYEMTKQINSVSESIQEAQTEMEEFNQTIRETKWEQFDYLQERISQVSDEADFLIDLMSSYDMFDDKGIITDKGTATLGLHGVNYNVLMRQADEYAEEMERVEKELAENPYNTDIIARREELLDLQQQSILAAEDEKEAIQNLVEDGIKKQLSSLKELIQEYGNSLDSAKDLYDYQKRVSEQAKNISSLQKQLEAYGGDISEETQAKVQKLKVELESAKDDLEETQYDKYVSDQKQLLDDLYDEYEKVLNERLDNIDVLVEDMIGYINSNAASIDSTLRDVTQDVGYTMTETMSSIFGQAADAMNADATQRVQDVSNILEKLVENGSISQQNAQDIINALGEGKEQDVQNTLTLLQHMGESGVISQSDASILTDTLTTPTLTALSTYTGDFKEKSTSANAALNSIADYVGILRDKAEKEAEEAKARAKEEQEKKEAEKKKKQQQAAANKKNTKPAAQSAATNVVTDKAEKDAGKTVVTQPSKNSSSQPSKTDSKTNSTQGDGKIQVGDKVTFKSGQYYYSSDGLSPKGKQNLGKTVYITKINTASWATHPYHISTGKKLGSGDLGWLKKNQISGYAKGAKRITKDQYGWTNENWMENGGETFVRKSDGAVLTKLPKDSRIYNAMASENMWNFANNPTDFIARYLGNSSAMLNNVPVSDGYRQINMGDYTFNINLPNVQNFEQFQEALQNSKTFEGYIQSITIDPLIGKSRYMSKKY